jgi:threonylcarbamoyladenosine tRNA methylthiotransferase MtaB
MVVGNSHKTRIADLLTAPYHGEVYVSDIFAAHEFHSAPVDGAASGRSRPNLKIQDGCNNRCSFCVIPYVRGRSRSAPVVQIVDQVREIGSRYPEVVLTGINLGRWGREAGMQMRLVDLLRTLLAETGIQMIRLSSVEPMDWSDSLLELVASSPRIAKHIHAPLQSGSDTVLRRMHRKYRPRHYEDRIRLARSLMPDAAIGADVMVGFPGETDTEFGETVRFIESLPFTYLHIFPYSERPGTPAAARNDLLPWHLRKERGRILKKLAEAKNLEFRRRMRAKRLPAVTLNSGSALTSNYLTVELAAPRPPQKLVEIEIGELSEQGVREAAPFTVLA